MPRRPRPAPDAWLRPARTLWEISLAAPAVVAHRSARIARAGTTPGSRDRAEFARMGLEKAEAFAESWLAMGWRAWQAQQAIVARWFALWLQPAPWLAVAAAGLKPVHRRVTANAKRLGRAATAGARPRRPAGGRR